MTQYGAKTKINLLFVLLQLSAGGAEKIVLSLARHLDRSRFGIHVAFFQPGALEDEFRRLADGIHHIQKQSGFDGKTVLRLARLIRDNAIDVVNCHHYAAFFYGWLASCLAHKPGLVYTEHSAGEVEGIPRLYRFLSDTVFFKTTGAVVGVSEEITQAFRNGFPQHEAIIRCISNGIDVREFAAANDGERVRASLGIGPDEFVVGTVANFRRVKNHLCLLRAFHRIADTRMQTRLVLVGTGFPDDEDNSEPELREYVLRHNLGERVVFAGYREDIPQLLHSFDLFCLPSFSEGLPVSLLEAMAAGVPVVGSAVRGIREVIDPGNTGVLFPCDDPSSLSRAILRVMDDAVLRRRISENAFAFVSRQHGLSQWIDNWQRLFAEIVSSRGAQTIDGRRPAAERRSSA